MWCIVWPGHLKAFIWESCSFSVLKSAKRWHECWSIKNEENGTEGKKNRAEFRVVCLLTTQHTQVNADG